MYQTDLLSAIFKTYSRSGMFQLPVYVARIIRGVKTRKRQIYRLKPKRGAKKHKHKTRKSVATRFNRLGGGGLKFGQVFYIFILYFIYNI